MLGKLGSDVETKLHSFLILILMGVNGRLSTLAAFTVGERAPNAYIMYRLISGIEYGLFCHFTN
jgi:hypothetical protein